MKPEYRQSLFVSAHASPCLSLRSYIQHAFVPLSYFVNLMQPRVTWEWSLSWGLPRADWPVAVCVGGDIILLILKGLAHWEWKHPVAHGPGIYKEDSYVRVACEKTGKQVFPKRLLQVLSWGPSLKSLCDGLYPGRKVFFPELILAHLFHHNWKETRTWPLHPSHTGGWFFSTAFFKKKKFYTIFLYRWSLTFKKETSKYLLGRKKGPIGHKVLNRT